MAFTFVGLFDDGPSFIVIVCTLQDDEDEALELDAAVGIVVVAVVDVVTASNNTG